MPDGSGSATRPAVPEIDLVGQLAAFVTSPAPRVLLIRGAPGSGRSTLVRAVVQRLPGPILYVAYRAGVGTGASLEITLTILDPTRTPEGAAGAERSPPTVPLSFAPTGSTPSETFPPPLKEAIDRLVASGGGWVVADTWDRAAEEAFRAIASPAATVSRMTSPMTFLRESLGRLPLPSIVVIGEDPDPQVDAISDGVVVLRSEPIGDAQVRVLSIAAMRGAAKPDTHFLYSLGGGKFYTPTAHRPGFVGPAGPAEPEPNVESGTVWPGSAAYAAAFGRLRHHALTLLELDRSTSFDLADVLLVPMVVSVVRAGGRVVWVPPGLASPAKVGASLARFLPEEAISQGVRVLSGSPHDSAGQLRTIGIGPGRGRDPGAPDSRSEDPSAPAFPAAYQFLRDRRGDGPALFLLSVEGLNSLAKVAGTTYDPATFPLVISTYARLRGFHGVGYGGGESPLVKEMVPAVDVHVRIHQRYGRALLVGVRPPTPAYLLDWTDSSGRYSLVPLE